VEALVGLTSETLRFLRVAAELREPVLLLGETGVGKNHVARLIHERGSRRNGPFLTVNCTALPESLLEAELLGHERGAFTGASAARVGLIEAADGGTLVLDEVGEIAPEVQVKLLQVLEDSAVRRLGSNDSRRIDARLVVTTNQPMREALRTRAFRPDLYYRLALRHEIPPLRDRPTEVITGLIKSLTMEMSNEPQVLAADALDVLVRCPWPGNVRELRSLLRRALITAGGGPVRAEHVTALLDREPSTDGESHFSGRPRYSAPSAVDEAAAIREALHIEGGHRERTAARLGMSRSTLWVKMKMYGIDALPASAPDAPWRGAQGGGN